MISLGHHLKYVCVCFSLNLKIDFYKTVHLLPQIFLSNKCRGLEENDRENNIVYFSDNV